MTHAHQRQGDNAPPDTNDPPPPAAEPTNPRHPEFSPPGEQQTRHDAVKGPRPEVPAMPSAVPEIPEKPTNPSLQPDPAGPVPERAYDFTARRQPWRDPAAPRGPRGDRERTP